ncbi:MULTISPECIES: alpha/beta fold hydrolase [unclassified Streptomyces]|uniref:alpha/beta fold hydrolase n=1 Tax=unclassified Streptomyces TaxID=2593676 RepID=UPI0027E3B3DB|nr:MULTISPECIES: alpha/beta fold hydrolase [unclassified Streptomyces]
MTYRTEFFHTYDGLRLAYHVIGSGRPLIVLPTGPGLTPDYLGDLGGLPARTSRSLVFLQLRGSGVSEVPDDPATYRCDRMVEDVEALRHHLMLERMDLIAHSQAGDLGLMYAARYPERLTSLVLVTPVMTAIGVEPSPDEMRESMKLRENEPWYEAAADAVMLALDGDESLELRASYVPFFYARWDEAAREHAALNSDRASRVEAGFIVDGMFTPEETRRALHEMAAPVLIFVGEMDLAPTVEQAGRAMKLFPDAHLVVQPDTAHMPWVDDPVWFCNELTRFLNTAVDARS